MPECEEETNIRRRINVCYALKHYKYFRKLSSVRVFFLKFFVFVSFPPFFLSFVSVSSSLSLSLHLYVFLFLSFRMSVFIFLYVNLSLSVHPQLPSSSIPPSLSSRPLSLPPSLFSLTLSLPLPLSFLPSLFPLTPRRLPSFPSTLSPSWPLKCLFTSDQCSPTQRDTRTTATPEPAPAESRHDPLSMFLWANSARGSPSSPSSSPLSSPLSPSFPSFTCPLLRLPAWLLTHLPSRLPDSF